VDTIDYAMSLAVTETLENFAFMEVFPAREEGSATPEGMTAALLIHEPLQGEIRLSLPPALLAAIAQTVFGLPVEGMPVPEPKDLLAELLNTIAGRFLIEMLPPEQAFRIGLPELDPPPAFEDEACTVWNFRADDYLMIVTISNFSTVQLP
jgi:hypothetical protein